MLPYDYNTVISINIISPNLAEIGGLISKGFSFLITLGFWNYYYSIATLRSFSEVIVFLALALLLS